MFLPVYATGAVHMLWLQYSLDISQGLISVELCLQSVAEHLLARAQNVAPKTDPFTCTDKHSLLDCRDQSRLVCAIKQSVQGLQRRVAIRTNQDELVTKAFSQLAVTYSLCLIESILPASRAKRSISRHCAFAVAHYLRSGLHS